MVATASGPAHSEDCQPVTESQVFAALADLQDPEIPVLTLEDLGVLRWIRIEEGAVTVGVAPTYVGCPAVDVIEASVLARLKERGYRNAAVERVWSPPWTTEWITAKGRAKLQAYGIAPPVRVGQRAVDVACPRCASCATERVSEFGSTPCKASYKCSDCLEPFEYFKCL